MNLSCNIYIYIYMYLVLSPFCSFWDGTHKFSVGAISSGTSVRETLKDIGDCTRSRGNTTHERKVERKILDPQGSTYLG